jgi:hypothetical protein
MGNQNFLVYTETDPNNNIGLVSTNHIDFESMRNEDARLIRDFGANYFDDFTHKIDVQPLSAGAIHGGWATVWTLADALDDFKGLIDGGETFLAIIFYADINADPDRCRIFLQEYQLGVQKAIDTYDPGAFDTWYYLMIKKDNLNLKVGIYSTAALRDAGDATDGDIDNLALVLQADYTLRYIYAANTYNDGNNFKHEVDIENLDLGEVNPVGNVALLAAQVGLI